jgi:RNA polymerase sigma-70 factor (ECF subfamily)
MSNSIGSESLGQSASSASTSTTLLDGVKAQDPEAWQRLLHLYGPLVYEWARRSGIQSEDAADVLQDVFLAVAAHVADFRKDRPGDSFRGWLWTITTNKIRDQFRRRQHQAVAQGGTEAQHRLAQIADQPPESTDTSLSADADAGMEHRIVELVRASVEDRTWQAFWLLTVEGRSAKDVADELDMNVRTVYEAKYRVMRHVRRELDDLMG